MPAFTVRNGSGEPRPAAPLRPQSTPERPQPGGPSPFLGGGRAAGDARAAGALVHAASQLCSPARPGRGNRIVPGAERRCVPAPSSLRGAWNLNSCPARTWVAWDPKRGVPQGAAGPRAPHVATHTRVTRAVPGMRAVGRPPEVPSESSSGRNQATSPSWPDLRRAEADARQDRVARGRPERAAGWRSLQPSPGSRRQRVKRPLPPAGMARRQRGTRTRPRESRPDPDPPRKPGPRAGARRAVGRHVLAPDLRGRRARLANTRKHAPRPL